MSKKGKKKDKAKEQFKVRENDAERLSHQKFEALTLLNNIRVGKALLDALSLNMGRVLYGDPEKNVLNSLGRMVRPDVLLYTEKGFVSLDLQNEEEKGFKKRLAHYALTLSSKLLKPGEEYDELAKRAIIIFICNFDLEGKGEAIYTYDAGESLKRLVGWDLYKILVINKPVAEKREDDLAKLLRDYGREDYNALESKEFRETFEVIISKGEGESFVAKSINAMWNESEARGVAKGEAKEKDKIIKNMIKSGAVTDAYIAEMVGLSVDEVAERRKNMM